MKQRRRWLVAAALCCGLLAPTVAESGRQEATSEKLEKKKQREHDKKLFEQLSPPYKAWLNQDVAWIITPVERSSFLQLSNDEEREDFIEQFWVRRNPNPQFEENTFEEEYYRRILYANEHFGTFVPGWKTDRGRVYVIWGPPDEIDERSQAEQCPNSRKPTTTKPLPWEIWRFRYLEGIGENVSLNFVYMRKGGDYAFTMDPCADPDSLLFPGPGNVDNGSPRTVALEKLGMPPTGLNLSIRGGIQMAPPIKFKELEALARSRIVRDQIKIRYQTNLLRATDFTSMVLVTLTIPEVQLNPLERDGKKFAQADLFGRISNSDDRRVKDTFEGIIPSERGGKDGTLTTKQVERYEHYVPLCAGIYRLDLAVKDVASGNVGIVSTELDVPWPGSGRLETSSLILGDRTEKDFATKSGLPEVCPSLSSVVTRGGTLDMFWQVYGLKVDERTHGNNASIIYTLKKDGREVWREETTTEELGQRGEELTIERALPVASLEDGKYQLQIEIDDHAAGRIGSVEGEFTVREPLRVVR